MKTITLHKAGLLLLLTATLLLSPACQKEEVDGFQGVVTLELREEFVGGIRHQQLYALTRDEYPCANFFIDYDYTHIAGHRRILFKGLELPGACITAFAPAKALIDLRSMDPGSHEVDLEINEDLLMTRFQMQDELLEVQVIDGHSDHLSLLESTMHRLGPDHHWGYIQDLSVGSENAYEAFFADLWGSGAVELFPEEGNYGFFRVCQESFALFVHQGHFYPQKPFVFSFDGDFDVLADIAKVFREQYVIVLFNGEGKSYHNQH